MNCNIHGIIIKKLSQHDDKRGWLIELFRQDEIDDKKYNPVMAYVSRTKPGVARGPHEHVRQADFFCFIGPSTFRLYLWDNRRDSPTYGNAFQLDAGSENKVSVLVPPGVVHAYKNIGPVDGIVYNAPNRLYAGEGRKEPVDEIRHEDDPNSPFKIED
jgi:dTDP-4-dehydrorhamnose 3,5-epimerase